MKEVKELLNIKDKSINVVSVKKEERKDQQINVVTLKSNKKKYKCPECDRFTSSVHDVLKSVRVRHLKVVEIKSELYIYTNTKDLYVINVARSLLNHLILIHIIVIYQMI